MIKQNIIEEMNGVKTNNAKTFIAKIGLIAGLATTACGGKSVTNNYTYNYFGNEGGSNATSGSGGSSGGIHDGVTGGKEGSAGQSNGGSTGFGGNSGFAGSFCSIQTRCETTADRTIVDYNTGHSYTEKQEALVSTDGTFSDLVPALDFEAYVVSFSGTGSNSGLYVCPGLFTTTCGDTYHTNTHRVQVEFLGQTYVVSEMISTRDNSGGSIKLASEKISGILTIGEYMPINDLKFHIDDLDKGITWSVMFSILDQNDVVLKKDKITPGITKDVFINGESYKVHVYTIAQGNNIEATWTHIAILDSEIQLDHGAELNHNYGDYPGYQVSLGWTPNGNALQKIVIYNENCTGSLQTSCQ